MIKVGSNGVYKAYLGNNKISKGYLGGDLIFEDDPIPRPRFYARLVFDGIAQIQTDIMIPENGSIRLGTAGMETIKGVQGIIGAYNGETRAIGIWLNTSSDNNKKVYAARYTSSATESDHPQLVGYDYRPRMMITPYRWQIAEGGTVYTLTKGTLIPDSGLVIGDAATGQPFSGVMGYVYIYDSTAQNATSEPDLRNNYTPIYTLKPCIYQGEAGYWCVETSTFYGNTAGAGTLSVEN